MVEDEDEYPLSEIAEITASVRRIIMQYFYLHLYKINYMYDNKTGIVSNYCDGLCVGGGEVGINQSL